MKIKSQLPNGKSSEEDTSLVLAQCVFVSESHSSRRYDLCFGMSDGRKIRQGV